MNVIEEIQEKERQINEKLKANNVLVKILNNKGKGKIVIFKDKKISRIFEIEAISYGQVQIIENNKIIESGLNTDKVGIWIYNLYNPVEYFYEFCRSQLDSLVLTREEVNLIAFGYTQRENVYIRELLNQPKVLGYLGPMFNGIDYGKVYLRYETQKEYNKQLI